MNWLFWFLIGWFALNALVVVGMVGKPRKPIDPGTAVASIIIYAILVGAVVVGWPA